MSATDDSAQRIEAARQRLLGTVQRSAEAAKALADATAAQVEAMRTTRVAVEAKRDATGVTQ